MKYGAAAMIAAPFCDLATRRARAAAAGSAKRLLVLFTPNGTVPHRWRPSGSGSSYDFPAGSILEPLDGLQDDLLVIGGMDFNVGDNHEGGMRNMLTCGGSISIDQVVADHIGDSTRFSSLELSALTSAWGGSTQTRMCYRDGAFLTPDDDPIHAFTRVFGAPSAGELTNRQSVIDLASDELRDLKGRLGSIEQTRLDAHLESLRSLERQLQGAGTCESPVSPVVSSPQSNDAFPDVARAQLDLAVQALACDATRVVTVQLSHTVSPVVCTWIGESQGHHELSHMNDGNTAGVDSFVNCERWFAEQFRYLVEQAKQVPDAQTGAPLLDDTVVLWVKELGDSRLHVCQEVPFVLAGGGGYFSMGRYVDVGTTHDGVLTSVANALGVPLDRFGTGTVGPLEVLR
ncbi:MAG: DUF1552 domain-containing protein [Myxococcales bacterium]|nr:DUF1552 domain-containing protein [Myxococcales bacterium]